MVFTICVFAFLAVFMLILVSIFCSWSTPI